MATIFTTWSAVVDKMKDQIAAAVNGGEFLTQSYTQPDGVTITYRTVNSMLNDLSRLEQLANEESSGVSRFAPIQIRNVGVR